MAWAASCLCYSGFLRAEEITVLSETAYDKGAHLNLEDTAVNKQQLLNLTIKTSKTEMLW